MNRKHSIDKIISIINTLNPTYKEIIDEKTSLFGSGIIDSLGVIHLVLAVEEEFQIKISNEELIFQNFNTIDSIFSMIMKKVNEDIH